MHIRNVLTSGFRNLTDQEVFFDAAINLVVGDNGQGKTNLLEAIHLLASLRSFRPVKARQMIGHGHTRSELSIVFESDQVPISLRMVLEGSVRRLWIGQRPASGLVEYLGLLNVVAFTPDDLAMIKGAPLLRRKFMDRASFLFLPAHLIAVRSFSVALRARNRLLARSGRMDKLQIDSFSHALAKWGALVTGNRRELVDRIQTSFGDTLAYLGDGRLSASLSFQPGWQTDSGSDSRALFEQLSSQLERDQKRGSTGPGPHRDDFEMLLGGQPARWYASQGQQRACALALLLAVVEQAIAAGLKRPVLLLDDVSSELDGAVRERLFRRVRTLGCQVLVTTTDPRLGEEIGAERVFSVQQGRLSVSSRETP